MNIQVSLISVTRQLHINQNSKVRYKKTSDRSWQKSSRKIQTQSILKQKAIKQKDFIINIHNLTQAFLSTSSPLFPTCRKNIQTFLLNSVLLQNQSVTKYRVVTNFFAIVKTILESEILFKLPNQRLNKSTKTTIY